MKLISRDYLHFPLRHQSHVCFVFGHKQVGSATEVGLLPQGGVFVVLWLQVESDASPTKSSFSEVFVGRRLVGRYWLLVGLLVGLIFHGCGCGGFNKRILLLKNWC